MKNVVAFLQVSHELTAPDNPALEYYRKIYKSVSGYHMPEHFMEIPTWIPMISGMLTDKDYDKSLHVVVDVAETVEWANLLPMGTVLMMSVMEVNRTIVHELLQHISRKFVLGGYVEPEQFEQYNKVVWLSDVHDLHHVFPWVDYDASPDYALFNRMNVIPRLTLSDGCLHDCAFCTIKREITERSHRNVCSQLDAMHQLNFELVYLDDKTFGQAENWKWLKPISGYIRKFNPQFRGFIVQTTVPMMLKYLEPWIYEYDVAYVEVGVEHVDEGYLRKMRKPYSVGQLEDLCMKVREFDNEIGFIPNLMFALPDADYGSTIKWVERNLDIIEFVNPFILCQYGASKGALVEEAEGVHDQDENSMIKSWLTKNEMEDASAAMHEIFHLMGGE